MEVFPGFRELLAQQVGLGTWGLYAQPYRPHFKDLEHLAPLPHQE